VSCGTACLLYVMTLEISSSSLLTFVSYVYIGVCDRHTHNHDDLPPKLYLSNGVALQPARGRKMDVGPPRRSTHGSGGHVMAATVYPIGGTEALQQAVPEAALNTKALLLVYALSSSA